jgi:hypothetical protein
MTARTDKRNRTDALIVRAAAGLFWAGFLAYVWFQLPLLAGLRELVLR